MRWLLPLVAQLLAPTLGAQQYWPVTPDSGAVVRLYRVSQRVELARLQALVTPDSLWVRYCPYEAPACANRPELRRVMSRADIAHLDVRRPGHPVRGALIGGGVTAGLLALLLAAWDDGDAPLHWNASRVAGLVTLIGVGAGAGALAGTSAGGWQRAW